MKNKREKKKISSSGKALLVLLCFALTVFFIALKGFSHSSEESNRLKSMKWDSRTPGANNTGVMGGVVIDDHLQSPDERSKMSSGGSLTEVGVWGYGPCGASFPFNDRLYMGEGRVIEILDISNPASPVKLSSLTLEDYIRSIYVEENYAYVAASDAGLIVVDVSNSLSPSIVGTYVLPSTAEYVYVDGTYAYLLSSIGWFRIVDISNPAAPIEKGSLYLGPYQNSLHVVNSYAYVTGAGAMRILDVSNAVSPVEVSYIYVSDTTIDVCISGSYAYVTNWDKGVSVIDVSDPQNPTEISNYFISNPNDLDIFDNYAYIAHINGLLILNISNPFSLSEVSQMNIGLFWGIHFSSDHLFGCVHPSEFHVIDVSNVSLPVEVSELKTFNSISDVVVKGTYAYILEYGTVMRILDISNPAAPILVGKTNEQFNSPQNLFVSGYYVYIADQYGGLRIIDASNPSIPIQIGLFTASRPVRDVFVSGNYAYLAVDNQGVRVLDISVPSSPNEIGYCTWNNARAYGIYKSGNHVYIADNYDGLHVVDVTDPAAPIHVGGLSITGPALDIHVAGTHAYLGQSDCFTIINIQNPSSPSLSDFYYDGIRASDIFVIGTYLYIGSGTSGLRVFDVSNSINPVMLDSYVTPYGALGVWIDDGFAYVADGNCGLSIIDASAYFPTIDVTSPNGGEILEQYTNHEITWTSYGVPGNVKIEYSEDNGNIWNKVTFDFTPNDGYYTWIVPAVDSENCLLRISDETGTVSDVSNGVFTILIPTTITLNSPNGGENWEGATAQNITWTSTGSIDNVMIEYSTNNGSSWNTITASTANSGTYNWTVENTPSTSCLVKISDTAGPTSDTSDAVFTIETQRTLTVTSPNGGENWEGTTAQNITWTSTGSIANVKLEYSANNGSSWNTITASTANSGTYNWTVENTPSTSCLVKVSDTAGPAVDTSDAVFTIAAQRTLTVTAPNGGENWEGTTSQNITWSSTGGIANVKLEYSTNNGSSWNTITASTANSGAYNWTVPNTPSTTCLVKISDTAGPALDTSDAVFTIAAQRTLTVTAPNGGESWEGTTSQNITWASTGGIANVKLEYSTNNGSSWNTVTASTANSGAYNWTVPNTPSSSCLVKVSDTAGPAADTSDTVFTIAAQRTLTVIAPNGGENWEGTTSQNITWSSTGGIVNVMIEYSTNNGSSWNTVTASTANSGSYNWTVPNSPSSNCLVKISDTAGPAVDTSDAVFTIAAQRTLTVIAPNGGENWEGTTSHNITWTSTGGIANVMIEYSTNNGSSWNTVTASTANSGSYNWTVPNTPSSNCLVKISDTSGPASDTGNGVFTIAELRTVTVTSPNGSERWFIDSSYPVTWQTTGNIANVMIEYSTNNGGSWNTVISSTGNSGSYNWTIPNTPSTNCLVRISDTSGPASDVSNGTFTIDPYPTVTVTAPDGGETWIANTTHAITWTYTGTIAAVDLEYSINNGSSWISIASSVSNSGSYNWVIPYISSTDCLVRVSDTATTASDTSNAVFTIELPPSLTVTSPNGGESWVRKSIHTITWTWTGTVGNVQIQYTMDGGSNWTVITSSTANNGSYQWTLPNVASDKTQCLVKIEAINDSAVDTSDAFFTILK